MMKNAFCASEGALDRRVCSVVSSHQHAVDGNIGEFSGVMVWVNMRKSMSNGGGGQVRPRINGWSKPFANSDLTDRPQVFLRLANQGGNHPVMAFWMRVKVGRQMDMENALSVLPHSSLRRRRAWVNGAVCAVNTTVVVNRSTGWCSPSEEGSIVRNVLGNSEHDTVKGLRMTLDHDAVLGHRLYRCVESNLGRSETSGELLWNGSNAFTGHHHAAVRHGAPGEISKGQALRERWVKGDASEERAKDTLR